MKNNKEYCYVELPIIRKDFQNTNSAKFKGKLKFISTNFGIIKSWKIEFTELYIDLYATKSWFEKKPRLYEIRENLFSKLNLKQKKRLSKDLKDLLHLNKEQLVIVNNFFNDRAKYNSTVKNIVGALKGNNPSGEFARPSSAEMIIDGEYSDLSNFVILFDDLTDKKQANFDLSKIDSNKIEFSDYFDLHDSLKIFIDFMQKSKKEGEFIEYKSKIKAHCKKYRTIDEVANSKAKSARRKFVLNVKEYYSNQNNKLPFGYDEINHFEIQKCHIYEYWRLRDKVIEMHYPENKKKIKKYLNMISDYNNFLPLPEGVHRKFDKNLFTYKTNGEIHPLSQDGCNFVYIQLDNKFKKIEIHFLNNKRVKFLEMRNENLTLEEW